MSQVRDLLPVDPSLLLHQGRSALLRCLPQGAEVFLSAGCSGTWFFEWVEQCYGRVSRHVGVEFYTPRPADLPANVEWICNTCSDMALVASGSCDLVFSGQNLEHLWPEEIVGFFREASRVTRHGGLLAIDSPNRQVTELMGNWSHPEHIIEFTVAEAVELVTAAGFDVSATKGVLLSLDPATGTLLPPIGPDAAWSVPERMMIGVNRPEASFIWWIEARRNAAEPDVERLHRIVDKVFRVAWPERVRRMSVGAGQVEELAGESWVRHPAGPGGAVVFGPYMPLPRGSYSCAFAVRNPGNTAVTVSFDVVKGAAGERLADTSLVLDPGASATAALEFELDQLEFGIQFRCISHGQCDLLCRRAVDFRQHDGQALRLDVSAGAP